VRRFRPAAILAAAAAALLFAAPALAHPPRGIVVDGQGRVYFSDLRTIWRVDAQGRLVAVHGPAERHTHELAIDRSGNVYGEDSYYDPATKLYRASTWRITPAGRFSWVMPPTPAPLPVATSIWRDAWGRSYYVWNPRGSTETVLLRRERDGRVTRLLGSARALVGYRQELASIHGAGMFGPDGAFYFHHAGLLRKATPDGRVSVIARDLPPTVFGLAVEPNGAVLLADFGGRRTLRFSPDGRRSVAATSEAPWAPTGVALRGRDLYLLEGRQDARSVTVALRVRRVPSQGRAVTLATVPVR
jgi:hypothetical protein